MAAAAGASSVWGSPRRNRSSQRPNAANSLLSPLLFPACRNGEGSEGISSSTDPNMSASSSATFERQHAEQQMAESEVASTRRAEETFASLKHLDMSFMRGFTRFIFNPGNPFIAGGSVLASVVGIQTAWLQATYEPLPHPRDARSVGYVTYDGTRRARHSSSSPKRLLVLGDSLVLGIGCDEAPVLANSLARGLSRHSHADVAWRSFGVDGGDTRTIHAKVVDDVVKVVRGQTLGGDPEELRFSGAQERVQVDVCVVLLGLNDFKRLWKGRTAGVFRRDLGNLCLVLASVLGPECQIVLPALPMEPTRFPEPLRTFVVYIAETFDAQKVSLAMEEDQLHVIPKPSVGWWRRVHEQHGNVISVDGVHPNEHGYQVYGEWLGAVIARKFFQ